MLTRQTQTLTLLLILILGVFATRLQIQLDHNIVHVLVNLPLIGRSQPLTLITVPLAQYINQMAYVVLILLQPLQQVLTYVLPVFVKHLFAAALPQKPHPETLQHAGVLVGLAVSATHRHVVILAVGVLRVDRLARALFDDLHPRAAQEAAVGVGLAVGAAQPAQVELGALHGALAAVELDDALAAHLLVGQLVAGAVEAFDLAGAQQLALVAEVLVVGAAHGEIHLRADAVALVVSADAVALVQQTRAGAFQVALVLVGFAVAAADRLDDPVALVALLGDVVFAAAVGNLALFVAVQVAAAEVGAPVLAADRLPGEHAVAGLRAHALGFLGGGEAFCERAFVFVGLSVQAAVDVHRLGTLAIIPELQSSLRLVLLGRRGLGCQRLGVENAAGPSFDGSFVVALEPAVVEVGDAVVAANRVVHIVAAALLDLVADVVAFDKNLLYPLNATHFVLFAFAFRFEPGALLFHQAFVSVSLVVLAADRLEVVGAFCVRGGSGKGDGEVVEVRREGFQRDLIFGEKVSGVFWVLREVLAGVEGNKSKYEHYAIFWI